MTLVLLLTYSVAIVGLGLWIGRKVRTAADFFVARQSLGPGLVFSTMLAANIGGGSTVGATGLGYKDGLAAWWWVGSAAIGSVLLAFWIGPAIHRIVARANLRTVGDYLEYRYGPSIRVLMGLLLWVGALFILSGQLIALAGILNVVAGLPKLAACVVGGVVVTAYFAAGGLLTSAWVNLVQLTVKIIGLGIAVPFALSAAGGWPSVAALHPTPDYWNFLHGGTSGWMYIVILGPAFVVSPGLLQKVYGARDESAVRWGVGLNALGLFLYASVPVLLGMVARVRFPSLANADLALPTMLLQGVPPAIGTLGLAAVFSAEISAADAVLFMLTTSLTQDLYKRFLRPTVSDQHLLTVSRVTATAVGVLAIVLAMLAESVVSALTIFYTLMGVGLFVPVLTGLFIPRASTAAALASIVTGMLRVLGGSTVIGPLLAPLGTVAITAPDETVKLAFVPLNATEVAPARLVPLIVTDVPALPEAGVNELIVGAPITVKLAALVAIPPGVVTDTLPDVAPAGTVATICLADLTVKDAPVPLNRTAVAPVRFVPVIVTDVPTPPEAGVNDETVGAWKTVKLAVLVAVTVHLRRRRAAVPSAGPTVA